MTTRHISVILVYIPPNTDSSLFINDLKIIFTKLDSENRYIFMIGDFNYDTFKTSPFKSMNNESESFTNRLAEFNMYTQAHPSKAPSATLIDNIYTNIQITVDSCESGILTRNISDDFVVIGFLDNMTINQTEKYITKFTKKYEKQNIGPFRPHKFTRCIFIFL